jgi:hypothetical protein
MQLTDAEIIQHLTTGKPSAPACRKPGTPRAPQAGRSRVVRCQCGACALCEENARWDRIFHEKFADPTYYSRRTIRSESPLNQR